MEDCCREREDIKPELSAIYQVPEELSCTRKKKRQEKRGILILRRVENTERIIPIDILLICGMAHGPNLKTSISDRAAGLESTCGEMQKVKC